MVLPHVCKIVGILLFAALPAMSTSITLTPDRNFTLPSNSNRNITYNCSVPIGEVVIWEISNIQIQKDSTKMFYADNYSLIIEDDQPRSSSRLYITQRARTLLPNLTIGCLYFNPSLDLLMNMPMRTIITYGSVNPPSNLEFSAVTETQLRLHWIAPNVPSPEIDILYYVQVTNLSSETTEEFNTTGNSIIFSEEGECSEFNLTAFSSSEGVGNSSIVTILENVPISPDVSPITNSITDLVDLSDGIIINIMFRSANVCSDNYPLQYYIVKLQNDTDITLSTASNCGDFICATINDSVIPTLSLDQVINYTVSACSNVTCRSTEVFTTYAASIQNPSIHYSDRNLLLYCELARSSNAKGCQFNFTSNDNTDGEITNEAFSVLFASNGACHNGNCSMSMCTETKNLPTSYLSIMVYAIMEDGRVSEFGQPVRPVNVTNPNDNQECFMSESETNIGAIAGGTIAGVLLFAVIIIVIVIVASLCVITSKGRHGGQQDVQIHIDQSRSENKDSKKRKIASDGSGSDNDSVGGPEDSHQPKHILRARVIGKSDDGTYTIKLLGDGDLEALLGNLS